MLPGMSGKKFVKISDASFEVPTDQKKGIATVSKDPQKKLTPPLLRTRESITSQTRHSIQRHPVQRALSTPVKASGSVIGTPSSAAKSTSAISAPISASKPPEHNSADITQAPRKKDRNSRKNTYTRLQSVSSPIKAVQKKLMPPEAKQAVKHPFEGVEWLIENPHPYEPDMKPVMQRDSDGSRKRQRATEPQVIVRPKKFQRTENTKLVTGLELPGRFTPDASPLQITTQASNDNLYANAKTQMTVRPENNQAVTSAPLGAAQTLREYPSQETVQANVHTASVKNLLDESLLTNEGSEASQDDSLDAALALLEQATQEI